MQQIDAHVLQVAVKKLHFDTISYEWDQAWNDGKFGIQKFGFTISPDIYLYLIDDGGEYAYVLVAEVDGSSTPGPTDPNAWVDNGKLGFQYRFDLDIKVTSRDGTPLSGGDTVMPRQALPNSVNQSITRSNTYTSQNTDTYQVMSSGGGGSASYTSSTRESKTSGKVLNIASWGVLERRDANKGLAAWTWHQQDPYDIYALQPGNFGDWWEDAFHKNHPKDVPALSRSTLPINTVSTWRIDHALVKNGQLPISIDISVSVYVAGVSNPDFHFPDRKSDKTHHHRLWSGRVVQRHIEHYDLAAEVGWWIPQAYEFERPATAPAFVGLGNWNERIENYPNSAWKKNYKVRYAVSFYREDTDVETPLGPFSEYQCHDPFIMPQLKDIPIDLSGKATERRLYRQFEGEDPVMVQAIPGYGPAGVVSDNHR